MNFDSPVPTPHNEAKIGEIAKTVLMPGDPLRAKYIAETYLDDFFCFNEVRNMLGFTGKYKGKEISVMGSGMGIPSIGIYSFELYKYYGVENIIRIGTCGGIGDDISLLDVLLVNRAYSFSAYTQIQTGEDIRFIEPSYKLNDTIVSAGSESNISIKTVNIISSDVFYTENAKEYVEMPEEWSVKATEMESYGLFENARVLNKNAACLLTVSDKRDTEESMSSKNRQNALTNMFTVALNAAVML